MWPFNDPKPWDPRPTEDPFHRVEYCWTLLGYSQVNSDYSREAQEVTTLRNHETDEWENITEWEETGNYDPGELRHEIQYSGETIAKFILKHLLDEQRNLPRPCPQPTELYDARYLRQLMSDEEKLFGILRVYNSAPSKSVSRYGGEPHAGGRCS